jgi:hypothetical protein
VFDYEQSSFGSFPPIAIVRISPFDTPPERSAPSFCAPVMVLKDQAFGWSTRYPVLSLSAGGLVIEYSDKYLKAAIIVFAFRFER